MKGFQRGDKNIAKLPEIRRKISEAMKGNKNGLGNKSRTGIKSKRKGMTLEQEYGESRAREIREKQKKSQRGRPAWNKGMKGVYKTRPCPIEVRAKIGKANRGKKHPWTSERNKTIEMRKKVSIAHKKLCENPEHLRKILSRRTPSNLEKRMMGIIKKLNLPYKFVGNGQFFIENKNPDFINCNGEKIAIEVFYQKHKDQFRCGSEKWKIERQKIFEKYGWNIIFLNEKQVNKEYVGGLNL